VAATLSTPPHPSGIDGLFSEANAGFRRGEKKVRSRDVSHPGIAFMTIEESAGLITSRRRK
jgi:hypothetical protein